MKSQLLRPKEAVAGYILILVVVLFVSRAPAQNLVQNGSFELDGTAIAGADGTIGNGDNDIDSWSVNVRGSGDYALLSTIGTFQGGGGGNLTPGVDLAAFQLAGGGPAAFHGNYHIDLIGAALGETNHRLQRLNSVLNQSITGLTVGLFYTVSFSYSTTDYVAEPRELGWRIDPEAAGVPDLANPIVNEFLDIGFLPGDPKGVITVSDREMFAPFPPSPDPADYMTNGVPPLAAELDDTFRTKDPNAVSATIIFDEAAGSPEAPVAVNWQTRSLAFQATSTDIRLSFFNNTDPFQQDEAEYHYSIAMDAMGNHDIWFANEVGMILDDISITLIPEPGALLLLAVTALLFLLRRSARSFSERDSRAERHHPAR